MLAELSAQKTVPTSGSDAHDPLFQRTAALGCDGILSATLARSGAGAQMPTLTDTTLTLRCTHCVVGIEFRPMLAHKDGRFVCRDCAHTVRPGVPEYRCTCRPCLRMEREDQTKIVSFLIPSDC